MGNLICFSGGLDSTLCLYKFGAELLVGFDYGQPHLIELEYASAIALKKGVMFERHKLLTMPKVNDVGFAGRNAVFIATAVAIAQDKGLKNVIIGCNFADHERFPDCRPEFIRSLNDTYRQAYGISVHAPLLTSTKKMIADEARAIGLPPTWSCYSPQGNQPCGECAACKVRDSAFGPVHKMEAWSK